MTGSIHNEDCIIADRGGIIENTHKIHAAVVDSNGRLLYAVGNPARLTLIRSAAKPAQALAILNTGCFEKCSFDEADLALICGSHNSEQRHIDRARSMLAKAGVTEKDLQCGGHPSISGDISRSWIREGFEPTAINNNCSGKHAGMLAGTVSLGTPTQTYHLRDNKMQVEVKQAVEKLTELDEKSLMWSIDGCNLPAPAMPLQSMAKLYAKFAAAADSPTDDDDSKSRMSRIFHAMSNHPEMVAGEGRFCTALMQAYQGLLIGKAGADGCYGIAVRDSEQTRRVGSTSAIGIAVKSEDGSLDLAYSVASELLMRLNIGDEKTRLALDKFHRLKRLNTAGIEVGDHRHAYQLRRCA